jgi:integrase
MDANITYDVRIWSTEVYRGAKVTTYTVRWKVGPKRWKEPFRLKAQAASFEAQLRTAASKGEAFDLTTGRPVSWGQKVDDVSWYDFCVAYVDMKWKSAAAHHRSNIAWALATVTPAMFTNASGKPDGATMRTALRKWGFNTKQRAEAPDDAAVILKWLSRNTKPVSALADSATARAVLTAAETLIDGTTAAPSTTRRNRAILHNAMEYAMETRHLSHNPVEAIKWKAPKTTSEVDRRCVVNHLQARRLLAAVRAESPSGPRLAAFYAVLYYAGLRPEEAVSLKRDNITLPPLVRDEETGETEEPDGAWGELRFSTAAPEVGAEWTDDGQRHDHRQLKARAAGEWRHVPIAPPLVRILRQHLDDFGHGRGGLVFTGVHGGELSSATYRRVWDRARGQALTPAEYASPLARRVYDLRHACVSTWLSAGVPPVQVAEWAGHSVAVLLRIYAKCIDGQDQLNRRRIDDALNGYTRREAKPPLPDDDQPEQPDSGA